MTYRIPENQKRLYHLEGDFEPEVEYVSPQKLLSQKRLDIIAKYIYIDLRNKCPEYAGKFYLEHIRAMTRGSFIEPFSNKKNRNDFINNFEALIKNIGTNGYDPKSAPVPVDKNYHILDGAHRVAACLFFNIEVPVVVFPVEGDYSIHDQGFFSDGIFEQSYLDLIILYYLKLTDQKVLCLNIWPSAVGHEKELNEIINENFDTLFYKEAAFNENGAFYYLAQIYKEYSWIDDGRGDYSGVYRKLTPCFPSYSPVKIFFLIPKGDIDAVEIKEKMRKLFSLDKHSLHMTDNLNETQQMAEIILSRNTISFLNNCSALKFKSTLKLLNEAAEIHRRHNGNVCFCGSTVLALYGLREANDVDFLSLYDDERSHNAFIDVYELSLNQALFEPDIHFYFFGLPFLTLEREKIFKTNRNEGKDIDDLKLMELFFSGAAESKKAEFIKLKRRFIAKTQGLIMKAAHKTGTFTILRKIYRKLKKKKISTKSSVL